MTGVATQDRFRVIRASAGSGKTYALTTHYLALLTRAVPPSSILATTFTRAAGGEIRDRILQRLAAAANDDDTRRMLKEAVGLTELSRDDVLACLRTLAANMHRLQIRTLDSFFAALVGAFTLELGIPPGSRIVDEEIAADLRLETLADMLESVDPAPLAELLRYIQQGGAGRAVFRSLEDIVVSLHPLYRAAPPEAWEQLVVPDGPAATELQATLARLADRVYDSARLGTAARKDLELITAGAWETFFVKSGVAARVREGDLRFGSKPIPTDVAHDYEVLIAAGRHRVLGDLRRQTIATRDLLAAYDECYRRVMGANHALTFADLTGALAGGRGARLDEMWYRLDARIDHLLLDEFQDTSIAQWRTIEPIASELSSDASRPRSLLCVGDEKQSIYGWRDACPEILEQLHELLPGLQPESLTRNRRSCPIVVEFVNDVFDHVASNLALGDHPDVAQGWDRSFKTHEVLEDNRDLPGFVSVGTVRRAEDGEEQLDVRLHEAATLVRGLHNRHADLRIGVLVRRNETVARLLHLFSPAVMNLPATGRGGGPLTDSPAVNTILDTLRVAEHPDDSISAFNVASGPLGAWLGLEDARDTARRRSVARRIRHDIQRQGWTPTIARWVRELAPSCDDRQTERLRALLELVAIWAPTAGVRLDGFVRFVERREVAQTEPAPIEVMTIHQSKGLEFDAVVLPELSDSRPVATPRVYIDRDGVVGDVVNIVRGRREKLRDLDETLSRLGDEHARRELRETLCLLYVAVTRARQGLYVLLDPAKRLKGGSLSPQLKADGSGLLRGALCEGRSLDATEDVDHRGDPEWMDAGAPGVLPSRPTQIRMSLGFAPSAGGRPGRIAPAPSTQGSTRRPGLPDLEARDRGLAIHAMLEQVGWIDDGEPDRETLDRALDRAVPRRDAAWREARHEEFVMLLRREDVRAVFRRPGEHAKLYRELPLARRHEGQVQLGFVDRVVLETDDDGTPIRASIVDFKTDRVEDTDLTDRAARYEGQLAVYAAGVGELFGVDDIEAQLLFTSLGTVTRSGVR